MESTKPERGVVISLDDYRERRKRQALASPAPQEIRREPQPESLPADFDEYEAEERLRLLTMPRARRPDERELL